MNHALFCVQHKRQTNLYLAESTVGMRAYGLSFSGISEFLTMSFQCFHWSQFQQHFIRSFIEHFLCTKKLHSLTVSWEKLRTILFVQKSCLWEFGEIDTWPLALKSKTKSKTRPSAGGRASNLLLRAAGMGSSAERPIKMSRSFESNLARSLAPRIPPMAQMALETQAALDEVWNNFLKQDRTAADPIQLFFSAYEEFLCFSLLS